MGSCLPGELLSSPCQDSYTVQAIVPHDEWQATDRRYLSEGSMALIDEPTKEVTTSPTPNELTAA